MSYRCQGMCACGFRCLQTMQGELNHAASLRNGAAAASDAAKIRTGASKPAGNAAQSTK